MTQRLHNCGALLGLSALVRSRAPGPHYEPHPRPSSCLAPSRVSFPLSPSDARSAPTRRLFSGDKWRGRQRVMSANEAAGKRASSSVLCVTLVVFRDASSSPHGGEIAEFRRYRVSRIRDIIVDFVVRLITPRFTCMTNCCFMWPALQSIKRDKNIFAPSVID